MINRKSIATLVLAAFVIIGTSAGSGGCGGSGPGGSAPAVGAGGVESEGSSGGSGEPSASSAEQTPNPTHDAQPPGRTPSDEPSKPGNTGKDPCINTFGGDGDKAIVVGKTLTAQVTIGPCSPKPEQYGGTLQLQHTTNPPSTWNIGNTAAVYGTSGTTTVSATCQEGYWVAVYVSSGRDSNGNDFSHTYSSVPKDVECT